MNKFLKIINEQLPTGKPANGSIPTGTGIKQTQQTSQPKTQQHKTSLGQIGGALRKIGSGFEKVKGAVSATKQFVKTGDLSVLQKLGQQLLNRFFDMDTYKISAFGKKNYDTVLIVDKELISKIGLHGHVNSESVDIISSSGLIHLNKFVKIIEQQSQGTQGVPEFRFKIEKERNLGTLGKQYTFTPTTPELENYLNSKKIKFVTFLREPNTGAENILGDVTFTNNGGKIQFYDMNDQFIQSLETDARFEYSPKENVYKIGSSLSQHSFAELEEAEKLLKKGIIIIHPNDRVFRPVGNVADGEVATIRNIQTHEVFHGKANLTTSPDKKTTFIMLTNIKSGAAPKVVQPPTQQTQQ